MQVSLGPHICLYPCHLYRDFIFDVLYIHEDIVIDFYIDDNDHRFYVIDENIKYYIRYDMKYFFISLAELRSSRIDEILE